jgi:hypothetical protein
MNLKNYLLLGSWLALGAPAFAQNRTSTLPQRPGMHARTYAILSASFQDINRDIRNAGATTAGKTGADPDRVTGQTRTSYSGTTPTLLDSTIWIYSGTRGSRFGDYLLTYGFDNPADAPATIEGSDSYVNYDTMRQIAYSGGTSSTSATFRTYDAGNKVQMTAVVQGNRRLFGYNAAGKLGNITILRYKVAAGTYDTAQKETLTYDGSGNIQKRNFFVYDSTSSTWTNLIEYGFITNSTGQILNLEMQVEMGSGLEPYVRFAYDYGAAGKFVRSIRQEYDGSDYVDVIKDSVGYSTGGVMVFENYYQSDGSGGWNVVYSERRHLTAQNVADSVAVVDGSDASYIKLSYNTNNLPTRVAYYDLGASSPTGEYRYYYAAVTPPPTPTSVAGAQTGKTLGLAPNPAAGRIRLDNKLGGTFRVIDLSGRLMMEGGLTPAASIGIEHLTPGIYSILMTDAAGERFSARFVKQ